MSCYITLTRVIEFRIEATFLVSFSVTDRVRPGVRWSLECRSKVFLYSIPGPRQSQVYKRLSESEVFPFPTPLSILI